MSGKGAKLAKANKASTKSGQPVGKSSQSCPPQKGASLTVSVTSASSKAKLNSNVRIEVIGPMKCVGIGKQKKTTVFEHLLDGEYKVTAFASGWVGVAEKKIKLKEGDKKSVTLKLKQVTVTKVEPDSKGKPVKWFINQTANAASEKGRKVVVKAHLSDKLKDVTVHFAIEAHKKNNKKLSPAALKASLSAASATTNAEGIAETTLELSQFGGDKLRVSAHLELKKVKIKAAKRSQWFEVWRRLFYEVALMNRPGSGSYSDVCDWAKVEAEYKKYFVELKRTGGGKTAHHRAIAFSAFTDWDAYVSPMRKPPASDAKRYFHMIVLDTIAAGPGNMQVHTYSVTKLQGSIKIPGGNEAFNEAAWCTSVRVVKKTSAGWGSWQMLSTDMVRLRTTGKNEVDYTIDFDLRAQDGLGDGPGLPSGVSKLKLALSLDHHTPLSGISWGDSTAVAIRWREALVKGAKLKNSTANTLIHEAGHNMGLAPLYKSDGASRANPGSWYSQAGPHCHEMSNQCVMWEANLTKWKFCPVCGDGLRTRNLSILPIRGNATH